MKGLASFVMRGRFQAMLVIVIAALLPFLNLFSGAGLTLVTLRQGYREGLLVTVLVAVTSGVLIGVLSGSIAPTLGLAGLFWIPLWLLAATLRYTVSLALTLQLALLLTALAMLGYAAYLGDPVVWGRKLLEEILRPFLQETGLAGTTAGIEQIIDYLAPLTLGLIFANGLVSLVLSLLLGRWWQGLLYNPGGFQKEFHELRLGRQMALGAALVFGLALLTDLPLLSNLAFLLMIVYTLQGLAVIHGVAGKLKLARGWLIGLYIVMFLALPQLVMLLCLVGIVDAWLDFRNRVRPFAGKS